MTRHRWDHDKEKRLAACESPDGNGRTERPCERCGLIKVTVHPPQGLPWREWRTKEGYPWQGEMTPPCVAQTVPEIASETTAEVIAV